MKRYRGFEFRRGVDSFAQKAASSLNLPKVKIYWDAGITTAGIDRAGQMHLADIGDDEVLTQKDLDKYCGFVLHELCHLAYTYFSVRDDNQYIDTLHNAVEDAFIEHRAIDRNLVGNVTHVFTALLDTMVDSAMTQVSDWADPRQYPFALAVYLRKHATKKVPLAVGLETIFAEAAVRLEKACDSNDTLQIARWVHDQLKGLNPPPPQKKPRSKKGDGKGKGDESAGSNPGDKDGSADDRKADGEGKPKVGSARAPGPKCEAAKVEPELKSKLGGGGTYSPDAYITELKWHQRGIKFDLDGKIPGKLRYNLKRLFDNSDYSDFQHNRKFGTVNASALSQYKHNSNVFKLRREVDGIDSAVVICLDVSGSMFSDEMNERRAHMAAQCSAALVETLSYAHVTTCILTFGSQIAVLKKWSDSTKLAIERLAHIDDGGSTNDYLCVRYAHEMLLARSEQRKVCIVITDGEGWGSDKMRGQIKSGSNLGITTIGIGIRLDVSRIYEQHINVKDSADLGVATFKNIKLAA